MLDLDDQEGLIATHFPFPRHQGKVRDVYDLDDRLLIIATDRISAFDWVLPNTIPDRGRVLTQLSAFWFEKLGVPHHLLSTEIPNQILSLGISPAVLQGRVMVCRKTSVIPFECVVRGYLEGSGWREYQQTGVICGVRLPGGLQQCDRLPSPIFTPATKAAAGHDENVTFEFMSQQLGRPLAERLKDQSLAIYQRAAELAAARQILIADTKFEWGLVQDELLLIDEVLTPDSSRFWPADQYQPGKAQPSFDKQLVREWLMSTDWDRNSSPPPLPRRVVQKTREKYLEVQHLLTKE